MKVAVGQHDTVVEIAARRRARIGGQIVHAQFRALYRRQLRSNRLLELVYDLALRGLELRQTVNHGKVVDSNTDVR
ncbi:MAG TPA: hypothetical protein VF711_11295, partial [Acidimicrobiales bacterium]